MLNRKPSRLKTLNRSCVKPIFATQNKEATPPLSLQFLDSNKLALGEISLTRDITAVKKSSCKFLDLPNSMNDVFIFILYVSIDIY